MKTTPEKLEKNLEAMGRHLVEDSRPSSGFYRKLQERVEAEQRVIDVRPSSRRVSGAAVLTLCAGLAAAVALGVFSWDAIVGSPRATHVATSGTLFTAGTEHRTDGVSTVLASFDGGRVQCFLAPNSDVVVDSNDTITLQSGQIWVNVRPKSGYFAVNTPDGIVKVTGTSFGVSALGDGTDVFLASGGVTFDTENGSQLLTPGQILSSSTAGIHTATISHGDEPKWVKALYEGFHVAYAGKFFPSVGK